MGPAIGRFLKAVSRLAKNKDITIEEAYKFAKQEFGEVSDLLKLQINKIFKTSDAPSIKKPKSKNNVFTLIPKDKLRPAKMEEPPSQASGIMDRIGAASNRIAEILKEREAMYKPKKGLDMVEGITRTLARKILTRKGIEIGKKDPIDAFINTFGEAIGDVKNLAEEMVEIDARGGGMKDMDEMLEIEGLFDIPVPKNPSKGYTDEELAEIQKAIDEEDILLKFDPEDREPNSKGGINRAKFARGKIKLVQFLAGKGKDLVKEIKKSVDDIFTTDDIKYDADVAVDNMLDDLGIDRDTVDQKDLMDAYGMAYDELKKPLLEKIKNKPGSFKGTEIKDPTFDEGMPFDNDAEKLAEIKMSNENFDEMAPKMKERFELKQKYPGLDDDLLTAIIDDPDPNNKAQVLATLEQIEQLRKMGKTPEEAVDIISKTMFRGRKDNAEGGLNYLMGM